MTKLEETFSRHALKVNRLMEACEKLMGVVKKETHDQETICAVAEAMIAVCGVAASRDRLMVEIYREENVADEEAQ